MAVLEARFPLRRIFDRLTEGIDPGLMVILLSLSMLGLGYSMGYSDRRGFGVWRGENFLEHDVYETLGKRLRRPPAKVKTQITDLGEHISPWRAEQKVAAAAAWLVLAG